MVNHTIFFLGDQLSFHHIAAMAYFGSDNTFTPKLTFDEIIAGIQQTENAFGILAVENTLAGDVPGNYRRICQSGLNIHGSISIPVQLNLAARSDLPLSFVHTVYSHAMAIKETSNFFIDTPHIQFKETPSTASAVKLVAESEETGIAAIGNSAAIAFYGLQVIAENIDNHAENFTRFLILSNKSTETQTTNLPVIASIHLQLVEGSTGTFGEFEDAIGLKKAIADDSFYIETKVMLPEQLFNLLAKTNQNSVRARVLGIYREGIQ